mgnify:CR=1 FL=1
MGQKVNPNDIRLGITNTWPSRWFALGKGYQKNLMEDIAIRNYLESKLVDAGVANIEIERSSSAISVIIFSSKPGVIIGRSGTAIDDLKVELKQKFGHNFDVNIRELKNPDTDADILAESVAQQITRRIAFRRAAKSAVRKAMEANAQGVKVEISGRLNGAEISRREFFLEGKIPLQTFRADISYASKRAETTYGTIGVKVWVFRGEVFRDRVKKQMEEAPTA